jgi:hypothetical protein
MTKHTVSEVKNQYVQGELALSDLPAIQTAK